MLPVEEIKDLLHQASLGLTRLQVISVVSAADVNDEGANICMIKNRRIKDVLYFHTFLFSTRSDK